MLVSSASTLLETMSAPAPVDNALARRPFSLQLLTASTTTLHSRHLKRIHIAAEILKARKICAGDAMVLRARPELLQEMEGLGLEEKEVSSFAGFVLLKGS